MQFSKLVKSSIVFSTALALFAFTALPTHAANKTTNVSGFVFDYNGNRVDAANVTVNCNGSIQNVTTAANGSYGVQYLSSICGIGDHVSVNAVKGPQQGYGAAIVQSQNVKFNIATLNIQVPEFDKVTGIIAFIGAICAFLFLQKKSKSLERTT